MERAYNVLERGLEQTDDRGIGPVLVDVPGANSRVKEVRWDALIQDTWTLGRFELDLGTGAEASTLTQTGDANLERDFFFMKPLAILGYTSDHGNRTRLRAAREVSQLDLTDFVTATLFEDNDLSLGNPNIRPETTWKFELSHEHRFGSDKVIKITGFYHAISDVLDLLPLSPTFEAPGNIGDGKVKGIELETSFPLDWLGLQNAKLDFRGLWQDTSVTDPVTGKKRRLSGQGGASGYRTLGTQNINIGWHVRADFRQDFETAQVAWGWTIADRDYRPLYKVNELDVSSEGTAVNIFVETTRWFGVKLRVVADNLLSYDQHRERTIFAGERDLSSVESVIIRDRKHDLSRFSIYMNGSF
jgi:outer membrane receptor protein involved in Fe transport